MNSRNIDKYERCYVCGKRRIRVISDSEKFKHLKCGACGSMWVHPDHTVSGKGFYTKAYYSGEMFRATERKYGYPECYKDPSASYRLEHYKRYIDELVRLFAGEASREIQVLDFGCGLGFFLKTLIERSIQGIQFSVSGIELDPEVCGMAEKNLNGAPVYCVDLQNDAGQIPRCHYDIITMLDVLEHLDDPRVYLKCLADCAVRGGYLLLTTPNIESFNARMYGDKWALHSPPYHTFYFGPKSIKILLGDTGWRVVHYYTERTIFHNDRSGMETWRGRIARALFQNRAMDWITNHIFKIGSIMTIVAEKS